MESNQIPRRKEQRAPTEQTTRKGNESGAKAKLGKISEQGKERTRYKGKKQFKKKRTKETQARKTEKKVEQRRRGESESEKPEAGSGKAKGRQWGQARESVRPYAGYYYYWQGTHHDDEYHTQSARS